MHSFTSELVSSFEIYQLQSRFDPGFFVKKLITKPEDELNQKWQKLLLIKLPSILIWNNFFNNLEFFQLFWTSSEIICSVNLYLKWLSQNYYHPFDPSSIFLYLDQFNPSGAHWFYWTDSCWSWKFSNKALWRFLPTGFENSRKWK